MDIEKSPAGLMSLYTNSARMLYLIHQQNHWNTKGYDTHLLFERLYQAAQETSDDAAEKTIGLFDKLLFKPSLEELCSGFNVESGKDAKEYIEASIKAEKMFQKAAKFVMDNLNKMGHGTLGLDDMIPGHVSKSEVHVYLLKQAL